MMTRLITKKMRDSFKVRLHCRVNMRINIGHGRNFVKQYFESTERQRILILRRTIK